MINKVVYIVSARSFSSFNPGRKISEVINVWKQLGINLTTYFGKDLIISNQKQTNTSYGNQAFFDKKLHRNKSLKFIINSVSEIKDILHDRKIYKKVLVDCQSYDLVWERSSRLHYSGLKFAKKNKIPYVLEWKDHLVDYRFSLFKWFALIIERKKVNEADYIVVESNILKQNLIDQGVDETKVYVALNAVDSSDFKPNKQLGEKFKKTNAIPIDNIIVGYLGSYAFYHNAILFVEAAIRILKNKKNVTFLMVGNGKDYEACKLLASRADILNKGLLMLPGVPKDEVPAILSAIDISILPGSTDIICPIKIMEYMASETAVVAPDYICNREVLKDDYGLLFEPNNCSSLANKVEYLINNESDRRHLSLNARKYVENELTWEKTWGNTLLNILKNEKRN